MDFQVTPFDDTAAYQIVASHDARFDGRLFVGVTSTGIYCRPICRVRTPLRRNCRFFATPAQAEAAGFRPCLRCRPEIAPGPAPAWTVMDASRTLARQAAQALEEQAGSEGHDGGNPTRLARVAERMGISERHLRRIFYTEHGVTPLRYLQTRRLLLAKQLLTDTRLPITQVASASGFNSLRRFNAAFTDNYRMSPRRLRAGVDTSTQAVDGGGAEAAPAVKLAYRTPYDIDALLRFIARRAIPEVEHVEGRQVRRSLRAGIVAPVDGWVEVEFVAHAPLVRLRYAPALLNASSRVIAAVRRWLDLDAAPEAIDNALTALPGAPGLRLPGSLDPFELAVRAVLGQQVSVTAARTLACRVVERFGTPIATPWSGISRSFPRPSVLAEAAPELIAEMGVIRSRAGAIVALAQAWPQIAPLLAAPGPPEPLIERLCGIPGIGPWTAHYIAMRALGWPDAFPPGDVAVLKAMKRLFDSRSRRDAEAIAQTWRPWRAYAVLRLWNSLSPAQTTG